MIFESGTLRNKIVADDRFLGGYSNGVPPLPIPNREVKPIYADGTAVTCGRVGSRLLKSPPSNRGTLSFCLVRLPPVPVFRIRTVFFPACLLFGHLPGSSLRFLLSHLGGQNPRFCPPFALSPSKFRSARSPPLSLRGTKSPTYRQFGLPFSNLGLSLPRGGHRDRLPFFHPGVIRQSRPEAFYGASEYAVERAVRILTDFFPLLVSPESCSCFVP